MTDSVNTRELVLDMLMEVTRDGRPSHVVHSQMLEKYEYLEKQERKFISRLFKGTLERMLTLDYVIGLFSSVKLSKIRPVVKNILRMGVYQILYMKNIPRSAACNEAVKLSGRRGFKNLKGFVNGILRNVSRRAENISWPDKDKDPVNYLSVMYSAPEWLVDLWLKNYGSDKTETMLKDSLEDKPVTVRCVSEKDTDRIKAILEAEGVSVSPGSLIPYALKLSGLDYLGALDSFRQGLYAVQDEGSMMAVEMAHLSSGDTVLDVCAAPGGKSCHSGGKLLTMAAASLNDADRESESGQYKTGQVIARDLTPAKAQLILENVQRLGLSNVTVQVKDATVLYEEDRGIAQVVLADLPCSGLGVLGRKADIKYRMNPEQMKELAALQRKILSVAQNYVAEGGTLVYSTCTVNPEENMENALWFQENFDFVMEDSRQYLPGIHGCDGFFISRFKKTKDRISG